jgi:HTH-type transcriptional regulator, sugar sensing transcriptional regulator
MFFYHIVPAMITSALASYGLSEKEAKVYLACLEYQSVLPSTLAKKLAMNRVTCYDILQWFVKKWLVAETVKYHTKRFSPLSPELLLQQLQQKSQYLEQVLPLLTAMRGKHGVKPTMKWFEGFSWMKALYSDTLNYQDSIYAFVGNHVADQSLLEYFKQEYVPQRVKKKIFASVILSESEANRNYHKQDKKNFRESRFLQSDLGDIQCEINIYGTHKCMIALYDRSDMCGFILESERIYQTFKTIFFAIWNGLAYTENNGKKRKATGEE